MKTQIPLASQATTARSCYICGNDGSDGDLVVAYWYWSEELPPSAGKQRKFKCADDRRCCRRVDRKWEAVAAAKAVAA